MSREHPVSERFAGTDKNLPMAVLSPTTLDDALAALAEHPGAHVLAGGTDFMGRSATRPWSISRCAVAISARPGATIVVPIAGSSTPSRANWERSRDRKRGIAVTIASIFDS